MMANEDTFHIKVIDYNEICDSMGFEFFYGVERRRTRLHGMHSRVVCLLFTERWALGC
jgi:hypothetical protein